MLPLNIKAPEFSLYATPDQKVKLSELKGKKVILAFYPADWSVVCSDQMSLYNATLKLFHKYKAELIGISVDSKWCHMAFGQERKLLFPLFADFIPKGAVAKFFVVYVKEEGESSRALYVLAEEGFIP